MVKAEKKETVSSQTENRFLKLRKDKEEAAISNKIKQFEAYQELMESRKKSSREKLAKSREILVEDTISVINSVNENDMFTPGSLEFKSEAFADFMADEKGIPVDREETLTWLNTSGEVKRGKVGTSIAPKIKLLKGWNELYGESKLSLTTYHQILTSKDQRLTCIIGMNQIAILNQDDIMGQKVRIIELEVTFQKGACYCLSPDGNILIYIYGHNLYSIDLLKGKAHTIFTKESKPLKIYPKMAKFRRDNITLVMCSDRTMYEMNTVSWQLQELIVSENTIDTFDINEINGDIAFAASKKLTILTEKGIKHTAFLRNKHSQRKIITTSISFANMDGKGFTILSPGSFLVVKNRFYQTFRRKDWAGIGEIQGIYLNLPQPVWFVEHFRKVHQNGEIEFLMVVRNDERWGLGNVFNHEMEQKMKPTFSYRKVSGTGEIRWANNVNRTVLTVGKIEETPRMFTSMKSNYSDVFDVFDSIVEDMRKAGMELETKNGIDFVLSWTPHGGTE